MIMLKNAIPSELFVGAIRRAYDKNVREGKPVTCSSLWDYICMECLRMPGGFLTMFEWDQSKAKSINRIGTIAEVIQHGYVPGLSLVRDEKGREYVKEDFISQKGTE